MTRTTRTQPTSKKSVSQSPPPTPPRPTTVECAACDAQAVFLAGTFNSWSENSTPMRRQPDGRWVATLKVEPGRHEYKFVRDGRWCCDDCAEAGPKVDNGLGTMNHVLIVE
ncbi:MAG: glycogen-binding domain-containing protein [Nannocystales bacterium]